MLSKALEMSKRTITDIFFWSMLLSNSSVKWSSAASVEWSFLFPLCRWCMTLLKWRKSVNCKWAAHWPRVCRLVTVPWLKNWSDFCVLPWKRKSTKVKELIRLAIMGAITGELALTLSQPTALGQELWSDSHGSSPSVSWMLKLCSSASFVAFKAVTVPTFA